MNTKGKTKATSEFQEGFFKPMNSAVLKLFTSTKKRNNLI